MSTSVVGASQTGDTITITPTYSFNAKNQIIQISVSASCSQTIATITITGISANGGSITGTPAATRIFTPTDSSAIFGIGPYTLTFTATTSSHVFTTSAIKVAGYDLKADFIFVNTSVCPTLIVFPNPLLNPIALNKKAIFVKDKSWNASVNNITIQATGGARIEDTSNFVLKQNGECLSLFTDLSEYYISSIYPSNNCGLMGTVDSTNSFNTSYLKAQAITDVVNVFSTDNTPAFNPDGSINTNSSTTQRQTNQNLVLLPSLTENGTEGFMCMIIYGGGISGNRHAYPLAFYSSSTNIDGTNSPYNLANSPYIATGNTSVSVLSTTAPNTITLSSLAGISPLTPIQVNTSANGISGSTKYYAMYNYNELTDGPNIRLSSTSDGFTPVSNIITNPLSVGGTLYHTDGYKWYGNIYSFLDNKLFPGQLSILSGNGPPIVGAEFYFDSSIYGIDPIASYVVDNIESSVLIGSNHIYTVTLTLGVGGPTPVLWVSPNTSSELIIDYNINIYYRKTEIPIKIIGTGNSLSITTIVTLPTRSTYYTLSIATTATITITGKGIAYTGYDGPSALIVGTGITFDAGLGSNIHASTLYYVGTGTTSIFSETYSGNLYISSTPDGKTLLTPARPSTTSHGSISLNVVTLNAASDLKYIISGQIISFQSLKYSSCYKVLYILSPDFATFVIVNLDGTPITTANDETATITNNSIIVDDESSKYILLDGKVTFQNTFNGFIESTTLPNYYKVLSSYVLGQSYVPLSSFNSITFDAGSGRSDGAITTAYYTGPNPLTVGTGIVFSEDIICSSSTITAGTVCYVGVGTTSVLSSKDYDLNRYTITLYISTTIDGLNNVGVTDTPNYTNIGTPTTNAIQQGAVTATVLNGDSTKSTGALFISDGTTWYTAGWYDPTNWVWDRTIPTDSSDYFNVPSTYSQFALTISPGVNSFVNLPKTLPTDLTSYWSGNPRVMPYFIIAKNTSVSRSQLGFSTYVQGNSNMFNDNATVRIYWVGSKVTNRPCIWFVSEVRPGETRIRYYPVLGYSP